jgi:hypothetical protein
MYMLSASFFGPLLARYFAFSVVLLASVRCESQPVGAPGTHKQSLGTNDQRAVNPVLHWNRVATEQVAAIGPIIDSRAFAILHAAIHDAVNAVERRFEPYTFNERATAEASVDAAVATAARDVLVALSPTERDKTEREYAAALAAIPDGLAKQHGVTLGRGSATANLARRAGDGIPAGAWPPQSGPITQPVYVPTGKPGDYAFTPPFDQPPMGPIALFPGWGAVKPFAVDIRKYPLRGPDPLSSEAYARDLDSTKALGSLTSKTRTQSETETAFFWFEPFDIWNEIGRQALAQRGTDVWESARILALVSLAVVDAGIACFEAKYRFRFWRPFTAIRKAAEDGNPATQPDKEWLPLLWPTSDTSKFFIPPIPDYPSAAATLSAAAAAVLKRTIGDELNVSVTSPWLPGVTRRFSSFSQVAHENGMARFFGGIHFLRAVRDGASLGEGIGRDVSRLLPPAARTHSKRSG